MSLPFLQVDLDCKYLDSPNFGCRTESEGLLGVAPLGQYLFSLGKRKSTLLFSIKTFSLSDPVVHLQN